MPEEHVTGAPQQNGSLPLNGLVREVCRSLDINADVTDVLILDELDRVLDAAERRLGERPN